MGEDRGGSWLASSRSTTGSSFNYCLRFKTLIRDRINDYRYRSLGYTERGCLYVTMFPEKEVRRRQVRII
jgi:hypothetical protein